MLSTDKHEHLSEIGCTWQDFVRFLRLSHRRSCTSSRHETNSRFARNICPFVQPSDPFALSLILVCSVSPYPLVRPGTNEKNMEKLQSESYCLQLQQCGLTASIAPDNKFEGDGDGEGGGEGGE